MVLGPFAEQGLRPSGRVRQLDLGCRAETRHLSYIHIMFSLVNSTVQLYHGG